MIVEFKVKAVEWRKSRTLMKEKCRCLLELCKGECGQVTLYVCVQLPSVIALIVVIDTVYSGSVSYCCICQMLGTFFGIVSNVMFVNVCCFV